MPNIMITTYCNLKCPYCFAEEMKSTELQQNITIEQLDKIFKWLENTPQDIKRIGIIGGEPTLHPNFITILNKINYFSTLYNCPVILFTNGIELYTYKDNLLENIYYLINYNHPSLLSVEQRKKMNKSLKFLFFNNYNFALGCTICQDINNYDYFWETVLKYSIKNIRIAVASPIKSCNKKEYLNSLKNKFLFFLQRAYDYNIKVELDCSQIPFCFFSDDEKQLISLVTPNQQYKYDKICTAAIDITPNFQATPCFGYYQLYDLNNFNNLLDLKNKIMNDKQFLIEKNKCCNNLKCQGGCLGFLK